MPWSDERKRAETLRKALLKRAATMGRNPVYRTAQRTADAHQLMTDTNAQPPTNQEINERIERLEHLETLSMGLEDRRKVAPATSPFKVGDRVHIRPEYWDVFGIDPSMQRARLELVRWLPKPMGKWDAKFLSGAAKGRCPPFLPEAVIIRA
jgi:hypothetical protein